MSVTRFGVSLLNVVATIERPASHHGTARPPAKNSAVLLPARRPKNSAGAKHSRTQKIAMIQSRRVRCMGAGHYIFKMGVRGVGGVGRVRGFGSGFGREPPAPPSEPPAPSRPSNLHQAIYVLYCV